MVNSQNGWPAYADTSNFVRINVCGRGWWVANGDVAVIFTDLINWFDKEIEPVVRPGEEYDDWSYANRLVRGSTKTVSNHGSATAIDINAVIHPRGVRNTFSAAKQKKIRAKMATYNGVVRWGGDYSTVVDDMHFEINASRAATKVLADKIRSKDVFDKDDKSWISAEIRKVVLDVLKNEKFIPNKPVEEGEAPKADWTVRGVLSALDHKTDQQGRVISETLKSVSKESE